MSSDTRASLHLEDSEALHDLVMTKLSKSAAISNDCALLAIGSDDLVKVFVLGNDDIAVNDISDFAEHSFGLSVNILRNLLLLLDLLVKSLGLNLFGGDVSLLVCLLLGSDGFGDVTLLLSHVVKSVLGCKDLD